MTLTTRRTRPSVDAVAVAKAKRTTLDERVAAFRELVREAIRKADEQGKVLKPYDGAVSLQWPSLVHTHARSPYYVLRLSCSVLGGESSHYSWRGRSWRTVFAHAAEDVAQWTEDMKREGGGDGGPAKQ